MDQRIYLQLEKLTISCPAENAKLAVRSTITFKSLDAKTFTLTPEELRESLSSGKIWVSRSHDCHLDFNVIVDNSSPHDIVRADLLDSLGQTIRDLPLWLKLPVSPTLEYSCHILDASRPDLSFKLRRTLPEAASVGRTAAVSILSSEVQPPEELAQLQMEKITVNLKFGAVARSLNGGQRKRKATVETMHMNDIEELPPCRPTSLLSDDLSNEYYEPYHAGQCLKDATNVLNDGAKVMSGESTGLSQQSHLMLQPADPDVCFQSLFDIALGTQMVSVPKLARTDHGENPKQKIVSANKMVDVAIRSLIGNREVRGVPGIKVWKPQPRYSLSDLMPSIWSPGFLQTLSTHSQFLPSVSKSLLTSLFRNVQSPSLRRKVGKLWLVNQVMDLADQVHKPMGNSHGTQLNENSSSFKIKIKINTDLAELFVHSSDPQIGDCDQNMHLEGRSRESSKNASILSSAKPRSNQRVDCSEISELYEMGCLKNQIGLQKFWAEITVRKEPSTRVSENQIRCDQASFLPTPTSLAYTDEPLNLSWDNVSNRNLSETDAIRRVLHTRLFKMMQTSLYDPTATRRLDPISSSVTSDLTNNDGCLDLLDDLVAHSVLNLKYQATEEVLLELGEGGEVAEDNKEFEDLVGGSEICYNDDDLISDEAISDYTLGEFHDILDGCSQVALGEKWNDWSTNDVDRDLDVDNRSMLV